MAFDEAKASLEEERIMSQLCRFRFPQWPVVTTLALALALATPMMASAQGTWTTLPTMPTPRETPGAAAAPCPGGSIARGCVYVEGGNTGEETFLTKNEIYNTFNNTWSTGAPMPTARGELGVAAARCPSPQSGTCIYAVDGDNGSALTTNEAYRPNTNTWSTLAPDPNAREGLGAAAAPCPGGTIAAGCVYAVGGNDGSLLSTNEAYSTFNNTWMTEAPMPTPREELSVAAARCPFGQSGTCIYALGGYDGTKVIGTVESYNPRTNTWTTVAAMPSPREALGAASAPCPGGTIAGGCVYAIDGDGSGGGPILKTVEVYNTFNNTWSTLTPDPKAREALAVAAARCPSSSATCIYGIGGGSGTKVFDTSEALRP
jgi:hypothetical protein